MQLKKAQRTKVKLRVGLFGPSGSGKTYSALLVAHGMTSWEKVAVIDTERGSADLYSHLGPYNTLTLEAPFTPERYMDALKTCEDAGMEVIIIDSISHEWEGPGGCLQIHEAMTGNSYTNWAKITPRHNAFIGAILQSPAHVLCCGRSKQDYVLQEKNGRQVPEKVGLKAVTREGFDYELTLCFDLDIKHNASSSKDRTGLFMGTPSVPLGEFAGKALIDWLASGADEAGAVVYEDPAEEISKEIQKILTLMNNFNLSQDRVREITGYSSLKGLTLESLKDARTILEFSCQSNQPVEEVAA